MEELQEKEEKKIKDIMQTTSRKLNKEDLDKAVQRMYQDEVEKKKSWHALKAKEEHKRVKDQLNAH